MYSNDIVFHLLAFKLFIGIPAPNCRCAIFRIRDHQLCSAASVTTNRKFNLLFLVSAAKNGIELDSTSNYYCRIFVAHAHLWKIKHLTRDSRRVNFLAQCWKLFLHIDIYELVLKLHWTLSHSDDSRFPISSFQSQFSYCSCVLFNFGVFGRLQIGEEGKIFFMSVRIESWV